MFARPAGVPSHSSLSARDFTDARAREKFRNWALQGSYQNGNVTFNFPQLVDHFDPSNKQVFMQRFIFEDDYYEPGGPVFVYLGGEGPMEEFLGEVQMFKWLKRFKAAGFLLEHRYYGKSSPVPDFSAPNMKYLSSRQALADAARFIEKFNRSMQADKWVIFGCSYSGCLSGWFRSLYPGLVLGSYAPSGPVLAQLNYTGYMAQFEDSAGSDCAIATRESVRQITSLMNSDAGLARLSLYFNSCSPLQDEDDLFYFAWTIALQIAGQAQEQNPPDWPLTSVCNILTAGGDPVKNFAQAFLFGNSPGCTNFSAASFVDSMSNIDINSNYDGGRAWWWQKCTEFGYFKSSYSGTSVFFDVLPVEKIVNFCSKIFQILNLSPNITDTNAFYGGKNLRATQVVVSQGLLDPWHLLGITQDSPGVQTYNYKAAHCALLHQDYDNDPDDIKNGRIKLTSFLDSLLL